MVVSATNQFMDVIRSLHCKIDGNGSLKIEKIMSNNSMTFSLSWIAGQRHTFVGAVGQVSRLNSALS